MDIKDLDKLTADLKEKYPDIGLHKIDLYEDGKASLYLTPTSKTLASLESASVIRRNAVTRDVLDLLEQAKKPSQVDPKESYKRSMDLYYDADLYGSTIDILANYSAKGFENDIGDPTIKHFYDSWAIDVRFEEVIDWIFLELFRSGLVRTYKTLGKYEPRVSHISPIPGQKPKKVKALWTSAARKVRFAKSNVPLRYTVLNPLLIDIEGSLLFDSAKTTLKPSNELKQMLLKPQKNLTPEEKEILKQLPAPFKSKIKEGGNIELDSLLVGEINWRKQPYERYPRPRGTRVFESLDYRQKLREADLSTLDGISNYILKITIGSDEYPVTDSADLDRVAQLFNTPSKSFDVVWNHTLKIEKIVSPEISAILGQDKYKQVNEDITAGLTMTRALVDGTTNINQATAGLITKTVIEEINYARRLVTRWIYDEYRQIAEAMGFDQYPKVRWDDTILRDIILYMTIVSQLVDRRMLSYQTALERLGFNYDVELEQMSKEFDHVMDGTLGIIGSPWQQAKGGGLFGAPSGGGDDIQPTQRAPQGTPSSGRPKGQPAKKKQPSTNPKPKTPRAVTRKSKAIMLDSFLENLDEETHELLAAKLLEKHTGEADDRTEREE